MKCKAENNQIKAGKTEDGSQKYKVCGKVYTTNPKKGVIKGMAGCEKAGDKIIFGRK